MSIMSRFKAFFKKQPAVVVPAPVIGKMEEVELPEPVKPTVKAKPGMPIVMDYPAKLYKAYWEVDMGRDKHKHTAKVRFYSLEGKRELISESAMTNSSLDVVRDQVAALVKTKMASYKR